MTYSDEDGNILMTKNCLHSNQTILLHQQWTDYMKMLRKHNNKQVKEPGIPHSGTNSEQTGNSGLTPSGVESGKKEQHEDGKRLSSVNDETAGFDSEQTGIGITNSGIKSGEKKQQEGLSSVNEKTAGDDGKKRENGRVPGGKEKVEKRNRRNKHKDKQDRHSKGIGDIIRIPDPLPPLKGNVALGNYSSSNLNGSRSQ